MGYINFDNTESYLDKQAKQFDEFQYEEVKSDNCLNEIKNANAQVESAATEVIDTLQTISNTYEEFTDFESSLSTCRTKLTECISNAKNAVDEFQNVFNTQVKELVKKDTEFISDLEVVSANITGIGEATEDSSGYNSSGGSTPASEPTPAPEPAPAPERAPAPEPTPAPSSPVNTQDDVQTAAALGITPEQLDVVKAIIRQEAGNNPAEIANVASCIKNRMNSGRWGGGNNAYGIVTAPKQFSAYGGGGGPYKKYTGGNYYQGSAADKASVDKIINDILTGQRPPTHSYESFRSAGSTGYSNNQLTPGGNRYK